MSPTATPHVILRARVESDEDMLLRCFNDLEAWEERSARPPHPVAREVFRTKLADHEADGAGIEFVIETDGRPAGRCTIFDTDPLAHHAQVGIALVAEERGRGVGTQAMRQLVEFGFHRWNLRRLHLGVLASNLAAIHSYQRVGFVEEGRRREHCWVRGRWEDEVVMGLLRAQWRAAGGGSVSDLGGA